MTVAITLDTDWAPDAVIEDALSLVDSYDVPVTVFSTHDDGVTLADRHERALHPNFLGSDDDGAVLGDIAARYPEASGLRSHSLYVHTPLRNLYEEYGIRYESNYMMFGKEPEPFVMHPGVVQFPVAFMDDMWLRRGKPRDLATDLLDGDGVVVYDFHPIHVYLNSPSISHYERYKDEDDVDALREARADEYGVRDAFRSVLEELDSRNIRTATLGPLADEYTLTDSPSGV